MKTFFLSRTGSILLVLMSMLSLTLGASLAKTLFETAGPSGVTVARLGLGALILCTFWRPWRFRLSMKEKKAILFYGICLGFMNLLFYLAIARLPIGLAIAIEFTGPLTVALLYSKKAVDLLWAFLAALGIVLILPIHSLGSLAGKIDIAGVFFALGAAAAWALYIILGKRAGRSTPAGAVTALGTLTAFLAIAPFGLHETSALFGSGSLLFVALCVGLLSSAIPYSLEMFALRQLPEKYFSLLMSLEPAIGAMVAFSFLGEKLTWLQGLAVVSVISASVGSSLTNPKPEPTPSEPLPS